MPNEGNIKASVLLILLKCIFVGYSNGNESFTGRLFSNYGPLNMLFRFFRYLIYSVFHKAFVKEFMKRLCFFSSNFKNLFQDVVYYRKLGCLNLWYWNGSPLNIRYKVEKFVRFWGCFFRNKKCWQFEFTWIKYFSNDFSFLIKWHMWIYYCGSTITGCRTWKQNWKQTFDFKLVYSLGKTVQEMVLDIYLREIAGKSGDAVLMFLMLFFKSIGIFS